MEHRNGERINIVLPASIRQGENFLGWFSTRDISRTGLALHCTMPRLANNSIITVTIEIDNDGSVASRDYQALVIRQQQGCLGLMWVEEDINLKPLLSAGHKMPTNEQPKPFKFQDTLTRENHR